MPKKTRVRSKVTQSTAPDDPATPWAHAFADPAAIFEEIEHKSTGPADADPYRVRVDELMISGIDALSDPDSQQDIQAMRDLFNGHVFEALARKTGFILGLEYCRTLLCPSLKDGGR